MGPKPHEPASSTLSGAQGSAGRCDGTTEQGQQTQAGVQAPDFEDENEAEKDGEK